MASRSIKRRAGVKKKRGMAGVMSVVSVLFALLFAGVIAGSLLVVTWLSDLPDYTKANAFNTSMPTVVYANDGETELARFQLEYRVPVEMDEISPLVKTATVATEDVRYYEHSGVDPMGIIRALINNFLGGKLEGASTITQQFVRNTILADEMEDISLRRKVREAYLAVQLEKMYSKEEVLHMYLNTINYGAGAHGIEAAAQRYFSKSAADLTLDEAALLVGIPQSPTYNDPLLYPEHALARRNTVLSRMLTNGYIDQQEYDAAVAEPIELNPTEFTDDGIRAYPYFTSYVRSLLYNDYDLSETDILKGGLKVITTLDVYKQECAEDAVAAKRSGLGDDMEVAMAVVDPATGNVEAIVGGSDWSTSQVNIATGQGGGGRPCGSVFKTFTLVTAIDKGIDPYTTYVDCTSPATVDGYKLENYANTNYGTKTIAGAFAVSSNTGFVRLISAVGVRDVAKMAHALGITTDLYEDVAGATLTLGVQDVTPLELASAVATIANGGVRHDLCAISLIYDRDGEVIVDDTDPEKRATRVISPEVAHAAQEVMKGVVNGGTGGDAAMYNGQPVAGKTGTSEDYKDIAFVGITPHIAAAIWVGDPTNQRAVPTGSCGDVFRMYATDVMGDDEPEDFEWYDAPAYTPFDSEEYHVSSYYQHWKSEKEKKAEEVQKIIDKYKAGELKEKDIANLYAYDREIKIRTKYEYSDKYEEGYVISQSVDEKELEVTVVVSKGKDPAKKAEEEKQKAAEEAAKKAEAEKKAAEEAAKKKAAEEAAKKAAEEEAARKAAEEEAARKAAEEEAARKAAEEAAKQQQQQQQQQNKNSAGS